MVAQQLAAPVYLLEPSFQESAPNSPSIGTVWNVQRCLPVLASNPRMSPGGISFLSWKSSTEVLATMMSPQTIGGEVIATMSRRHTFRKVFTRSTRPPEPKDDTGFPVRASNAMRYSSRVDMRIRRSEPDSQYATPRWTLPYDLGV